MKARKGRPLLALISALMAATSASSARAWENPLENPYLDEPLEVCDQGSFFVGGVPKVTKYAAGRTAGDPQQITIGQAYVQFQVPKTRRQWPIIFVHGSSHTGATLDSTPDGKEGWHSYAVRHNLASFVMDQPGRGRSGFDQSVLHEAKATGNWEIHQAHCPWALILMPGTAGGAGMRSLLDDGATENATNPAPTEGSAGRRWSCITSTASPHGAA